MLISKRQLTPGDIPKEWDKQGLFMTRRKNKIVVEICTCSMTVAVCPCLLLFVAASWVFPFQQQEGPLCKQNNWKARKRPHLIHQKCSKQDREHLVALESQQQVQRNNKPLQQTFCTC